jgi:excisionase family DNA binding protein
MRAMPEDIPPDDDLEWLSTPGAAERIGVTPRTLYRFIDEGQLPAFKFGRVIRLKKADVDTYIESCRVEPGSMSHLYPETSGGT